MARFEIRNQFYLDGQPFQIISGSLHYFRIPPEYWDDRLKKLKAMGCNTVETYVPWNLHEPKPGVYRFEGELDLSTFLGLAQENGLYAIVRPSPYICAEWEFGGLPFWLLDGPDIPLRSLRGPFLDYVAQYYKVLFPHLIPWQINNGGPVILMQVENEFGAWGQEDPAYLSALASLMRDNGATVPFITSDNLENNGLSQGICPEALATINFGSGAAEKLDILRPYTKGGPLMVTEFWVGWFDAWGDDVHHRTDPTAVTTDLEKILDQGSVNFYMFHGGTNFGFMNGANYYDHLTPDVTSYDYDAPLSEDGQPTEKYFAIQRILEGRNPGSTGPLPAPMPRRRYGRLEVKERVGLFHALEKISTPYRRATPCSMERLGQGYGYVLYCTKPEKPIRTEELAFTQASDRVQIFQDGEWLDILAENLGRVNYGSHMNSQRKGIDGPVRYNGRELEDWVCWPLSMDNLNQLDFTQGWTANAPAFYRFSLFVDIPADTFLDMTGWGKGVAVVNGKILGRFWDKGPQRRLYLPAPWLHAGENEIILFETEGRVSGEIFLAETPDLGVET